MFKRIALASSLVLGACSTQQMQQVATVACTVDPLAYSTLKAGSTIATIVDPSTVAVVAPLNAVDAVLHPAVIAACGQGSVPVAGTVNVVSVPVAPPVSQTTLAILPTSSN